MSHYFHVVLVRPPSPEEPMREDAIEEEVTRLMAPYDENMQVAAYRRYYAEDDIARMRKNYEVDEGCGPLTLTQLAGKMEDWHGSPGGVDERGLYYVTQYNTASKWDYWIPGGRWNGVMRNTPRSSADDGGFNWDEEFRQLPENMVPVAWLDHTVNCHSLLTPEGEWHDSTWRWWDEEPWAHYVRAERDSPERLIFDAERERREALWDEQVVELLKQYTDCIAVGVDFHM